MPTTIDRQDVRRLMEQGAQLLEVLPRAEYDEAHLPGAASLPLGELTPSAATALDRRRPVITYCYDTQCDLSPRAAWRLETLGFQRVYHYAAGKADWMGAGLPIEGTAASIPFVADVARRDVPTCQLATPLSDVRQRLESSNWDTCFVINEHGVVLGRLYLSELSAAIEGGQAVAEEAMDPGPSTFRPDMTALELAQRMQDEELETAPVTASDGTLVGLAMRADVERAAEATDTGRLRHHREEQAPA